MLQQWHLIKMLEQSTLVRPHGRARVQKLRLFPDYKHNLRLELGCTCIEHGH
jgi:hypothetical protein